MLILLFYSLVSIFTYSYFFDIVKEYYLVYQSKTLTWVIYLIYFVIFKFFKFLIALGIWLSFNIIFNYSMSVLISPGDNLKYKVNGY